MKNGNYLLYNQEIKGNKKVDSDELLSLLPQKPNKRFLFTFRTSLARYVYGEKRFKEQLENKYFETKIENTKAKFVINTENLDVTSQKYIRKKSRFNAKIEKYQKRITDGNWYMQNFGEPPVYFSTKDAEKNSEKIKTFLFTKGYFNAKSTFEIDSSNKEKVKVSYYVEENKPYFINKITYQTNDNKIDSLLSFSKSESLIKENEQYSNENITNEYIRIENLAKDNGFYLFDKNMIRYQVKFLFNEQEKGVAITQIINSDKNQLSYQIGKVQFIVDESLNLKNNITSTDSISNNGIDYVFIGKKFSTKYLFRKIFLRPGEVFSLTKQIGTQRALQNLDQFKFTNPIFDTLNNKLNIKIYAIPLEKFQFSGEGGGNVFNSIVGPFADFSLKIRNIFNRLESLENNLRIGFEGQNIFVNGGNKKLKKRGLELGYNTAINIPRIFLPGNFSKLDGFNPRTQIGIGLNYTDNLSYERLNFKISTNYSWQKTQKKQFNLSLIDLNLTNTPYKSPAFDSTLNYLETQGNFISKSFGKSFVSSISGSFIYNDNFLGQSQKGKYLRIFGELGGSFLNLTSTESIPFLNKLFGSELNYFKFIRILADYRRFIPVGSRKGNILAFRFNTGLALSYNKDKNILPYEKYLFAGGSYGMRGWLPRRLGLEDYGKDKVINQSFKSNEQPGNLHLESSIEYRFPLIKLYGQINGAFFADLGNVWTIPKKGNPEKNSDFALKSFINQLALDTGFGLRWDFTYFVFRLDAAVKVIEPLEKKGNRFVFDDLFKKATNEQNTQNYSTQKIFWNFGIGYPF